MTFVKLIYNFDLKLVTLKLVILTLDHFFWYKAQNGNFLIQTLVAMTLTFTLV